jgi:hypothetical protein
MYLSERTITEIVNAVGDVCALVFGAYYVLLLALSIIYSPTDKDLGNSRVFRVVVILHFTLALPIVAIYWISVRLLSIPLYVFLAIVWLWSRAKSLAAKSN